ncbi:hypothetical protein H0H81_008398 [Sphagnurus paluster]|uniref:Uncharacterized protein n=1 Tax=Sphagnurus paluster TaxID=117069 RepID=A0A9P7GIY2_9AGAR|nr:hypothetical protein H0H81_008398 [Sphagnurus paluster]
MASKDAYARFVPDVLPYTMNNGTRQTTKSELALRVLKYLALCSAAITLSSILPTPWSLNHVQTPVSRVKVGPADPASEWEDNIWPLREQTPWDISTDFPYPRKLEYEVQEGTWLRLDVHPTSGDIVFDMIGDIYCLPAAEVATRGLTRARPILLGVPFDSDPHFSPEGDRIVFRSDAELGVENIWVTRWKGCEAMDLRPTQPADKDLLEALKLKESEERLLAEGHKETLQRKHNRLVREGRIGAQRVTNETYRWVSDARFHPFDSTIITTKWYTSSRSLGAGEGWQYHVPSADDLESHKERRVVAGEGSRIVSRSLPRGWSSEEYGDQQIGPEQHIWNGGDSIIYSKNIVDESAFAYSKDVHKGIYAIFQKNLTTGQTETLVSASPGGASRPELSRDGRTLAFVRRVRDKEALVLKDLQTGTIHHVWYGLTYDLSTISAPMGTYPSFAFTPSDDAVIIWAAGQIYNVSLTINDSGEKIASSTEPVPIPFVAHIEKRLAETRHSEYDLVKEETKLTQRVRAFKELRVDDTGARAVFQAAGVTYVQDISHKATVKVPVLDASSPYYSPVFVHGADNLVLHARWSDTNFTSFEIADLNTGVAHALAGLPLGRYFSPILCECSGPTRQIAFIKSGGSILTGDVVATANTGLYLGTITLPADGTAQSHTIKVRDLRLVKTEIDVDDRASLRFLEKNKKLLVQQSQRAFIIDLATGANEVGQYVHSTIASGKMSSELVVSPREVKSVYAAETIAFVDFFHVYLAPGNTTKADQEVWSRPGNATKGLVRLSLDGGHDVTFTRDGKKLFWFLGMIAFQTSPNLARVTIDFFTRPLPAFRGDFED